jgi:hypothetical protein
MRHMLGYENLSILISRSTAGQTTWQEVQCSNTVCEFGIMSTRPGNGTPLFPLYLYPEEGTLETERRVNFDPKIYAEIKARAGLHSSPERGGGPSQTVEGHVQGVTASKGQENRSVPLHHPSDGSPPRAGEDLPDELRVFDYIYGVLHSPDYRRTYAQFLKIDFPRIPYPASPEVFAHVAEKGGALRRLHLMEDAAIGDTPYPFSGDGDNVVVKPAFAQIPFVSSEDDTPIHGAPLNGISCSLDANGLGGGPNGLGRVMINPDQYFDNVPQIAWEFHIGGYQPAQKWLKDRKGRALSFDDVLHYQKIIKILTETDRIMKEIELPL